MRSTRRCTSNAVADIWRWSPGSRVGETCNEASQPKVRSYSGEQKIPELSARSMKGSQLRCPEIAGRPRPKDPQHDVTNGHNPSAPAFKAWWPMICAQYSSFPYSPRHAHSRVVHSRSGYSQVRPIAPWI